MLFVARQFIGNRDNYDFPSALINRGEPAIAMITVVRDRREHVNDVQSARTDNSNSDWKKEPPVIQSTFYRHRMPLNSHERVLGFDSVHKALKNVYDSPREPG